MIVLLLLAGAVGLDAHVALTGDADPDLRRRARAGLLAAGERAVPALQRGLAVDDPEVRRACATLLDRLAARVLAGPRRHPDYEIPDNKATQYVRRGRGHNRRFQAALAANPALLRGFVKQYRGRLEEPWEDATPADYGHLLVTLAGRLGESAEAALLARIEAHLVAKAVAWKLAGLPPSRHWSSRWLVRRRVLPALRRAIRSARAAANPAEHELYAELVRTLRPLCDAHAERARLALARRLAGGGGS